MKLVIIGTGYVGLVTGACLAEVGHTVYCVDKDKKKIANLKKGILPIYEPELDHYVERNIKNKRLSFCDNLADVIDKTDALFLAVGTPPKADHSADLSAVIEVSKQIGSLAKKPFLVITKSTVPVGTSELVRKTIQDKAPKLKFHVASNPEFLREGVAVRDFMNPDRIVVGADSPEAKRVLQEIYRPFTQNDTPLVITSIPSAEVIKYASNAFLATKISFINEVANFCEATGADIDQVAHGMGLDERIGLRYLHAGLGYGGSCFPKDVKALIATGAKHDLSFQLLRAVEDVNAAQRLRIVEKIKKHVSQLKGKTIAIWGLAFKAKTDDTREAPSLTIIEALVQEGAKVHVYDPVVRWIKADVTHAPNPYDCCKNADVLAILTEWEDFLYPDFDLLKKSLKKAVIVDGRNLYDPKTMKAHGFTYDSIGRKS